jgi:hypothetical protein
VSAKGILACKPCLELQVQLPEDGQDDDGSEMMEMLETIKMYNLCGFDDDIDDVEIEIVFPTTNKYIIIYRINFPP